jgi:hypothetical protein
MRQMRPFRDAGDPIMDFKKADPPPSVPSVPAPGHAHRCKMGDHEGPCVCTCGATLASFTSRWVAPVSVSPSEPSQPIEVLIAEVLEDFRRDPTQRVASSNAVALASALQQSRAANDAYRAAIAEAEGRHERAIAVITDAGRILESRAIEAERQRDEARSELERVRGGLERTNALLVAAYADSGQRDETIEGLRIELEAAYARIAQLEAASSPKADAG